MVGSEGTLGFVVEATVGLVPLPAREGAGHARVRRPARRARRDAARSCAHGPSAVEVMDDFILEPRPRQRQRSTRMRRSIVQRDGSALLCVEFYGDHADDAAAAARRRSSATSPAPATRLPRAAARSTPAAQARVWSLREAALGLSMAMKGDAKAISFVEDTAVAPENGCATTSRASSQIVERHGTAAGVYAHASVGLPARAAGRQPEDRRRRRRRSRRIANEVADLVLEFGGALSGEHGDGLVRGAVQREDVRPDALPGVPRGQAHLRSRTASSIPAGSSTRRRSPRTCATAPATDTPDAGHATSTIRRHGGFGRAVEMCSGVGACRKTREGTMCPSYMATRDEAHSTRGRANVLRLAMTGQLGEPGLDDHGVHEVLDLCLECRACKSECPVERGHGADQERVSRRLLGPARRCRSARRPSATCDGWRAGAAAWRRCRTRWPAARRAARWARAAVGIDRRRHCRRSGRASTLSRRLAAAADDAPAPRAVLFADTFTEYVEPGDRRGGARRARRAGLGARAGAARLLRTSADLAGPARARRDAQAAANVRRAATTPRPRGRPIVFVEPSCLSAVREDAPALLRGDGARAGARRWPAPAVLFEEYLERELAAGRASLQLQRRAGQRCCCTPHCHQRSMGLAAPATALLRAHSRRARSPISTPAAAAWPARSATRRDHYDVSRAIGERKLLPAARALAPGAVLVAAGTSCRHQVRALHRRDAPCTPRCCCGRCWRSRCMNLAWISLAALVIAVTLSMVTQVNVGVVSLALAWIVGVYLGGMPLSHGDRHLPDRSCSSRWPASRCSSAWPTSTARCGRLAARAVRALPRQRRRHPGDVLRGRARACRASAPATSRPTALWRRWRWRSARRPAVPPFLMALMVGNGAQAGALSPFAPTGVIVNGVMERIGLGGYE